MGCIRGSMGLVSGDRCIFQINFSGVTQVLLHYSQPFASAYYSQLGIKKKTTKKAFYFAPVGLSPPAHSTQSQIQLSSSNGFFFSSPWSFLGWSWTDNLRDCLFGLAADQECHFTKKCWGFRNKVSLQCGMKLGHFKHCQETASALAASCFSPNSPPSSWRAEHRSALWKTRVWMAPERVSTHF